MIIIVHSRKNIFDIANFLKTCTYEIFENDSHLIIKIVSKRCNIHVHKFKIDFYHVSKFVLSVCESRSINKTAFQKYVFIKLRIYLVWRVMRIGCTKTDHRPLNNKKRSIIGKKK